MKEHPDYKYRPRRKTKTLLKKDKYPMNGPQGPQGHHPQGPTQLGPQNGQLMDPHQGKEMIINLSRMRFMRLRDYSNNNYHPLMFPKEAEVVTLVVVVLVVGEVLEVILALRVEGEGPHTLIPETFTRTKQSMAICPMATLLWVILPLILVSLI